MDQSYFEPLAAAFVRGKLADDPAAAAHAELFARPIAHLAADELQALIQLGLTHDLRLQKFKRTMDLARVRKVLGILHGLHPDHLLDVGSGRGAFLWPLLDSFPGLPVTAVDLLDRRVADIEAVRRGGVDQIRAELGIDPADDQGKVVRAAKERARQLLRRRQPFAWNATNITRQVRAPLIDLFASYRARVRLAYVDAPFDVLMARNQQRKNAVPARIVERLASRLEVPDLTEAHIVEWLST
jgi:predicted kinase